MIAIDAPSAASVIDSVTEWTRLALDAASVIVIAIGGVQTFRELPRALRGRMRFTQVRLDFARYLAMALEFQLASDVLQTAIAPTWEQLGILGAVATIRTALNFFLSREMEHERELVGTDDGGTRSLGTAVSEGPASGPRTAAGTTA
jgi:uncharacterized membrane protein